MRSTKLSQKTLVSVIIPVYNGASYLEEAVVSVFKNTYKKVEVILVDDGSTDKSREICHQMEKKYGKTRVHFYAFSQNQGLVRVLNFAINKAKGQFIARLNQDDIMAPERIEKQLKFFEQNPDHVVVGSTIELFRDDNSIVDRIEFPFTDSQIRNQWLMLSPYSDPSVMYRKAAWKKTKGYSQRFWPADDVHMWYQLGQVGKMANIDEVLTFVRWHEGAGSIRFHKIQMEKTWELHWWAAKNIQTPPPEVFVFWIGQYIAGKLFPPQFNWYVFRILRKVQTVKRNMEEFVKESQEHKKLLNRITRMNLTTS